MKISKLLKRSLLALAVVLGLLIIAAVAIPYFFKDEIVAWVKEDVNKSLNAVVDFDDVQLSLIRSFPDFNLRMENLSITGVDDFQGLALLKSKNLELDLNLLSVIKQDQPIAVNRVVLDEPEVNIRILKNGKYNYDIAKASAPDTSAQVNAEASNVLVQLKSYEIINGRMTYDDRTLDYFMELEGIDHEGFGDFTQEIFDLDTKTSVERLTANYEGINYLYQVRADMDALLNMDMNQMKFSFKDNELTLNDLKLTGDGYFQLVDEDIKMDVNYQAPANSFKNFLSLIPYAYTKDFASVQANGELEFYGFVKGTYNAVREEYPAFRVYLDINKADFKYPDLPMGISNILAKMTINSPSSNFDQLTLDVPQFRMKLGNNPFSARFNLATPISDPALKGQVNGVINLADLAKAFPMEGVSEMTGLITADLEADTRMSYVDQKRYEDVNMSGTLRLQDINYKAEGTPPVRIKDMGMSFSPRFVELTNFDALLGESDLKAKGRIDNILAYFSPEKTMTGNLMIRSAFFNANEWMGETETTSQEVASSETETPAKVFDQFDFSVDGKIDRLKYDVYELNGLAAKGRFTPSVFEIDNFQTQIGESDIRASGKLTNVFNYVFDNETLGGSIQLASNYLNLNQFMEEAPSGQPQAKAIANETDYAPIPVPEKMKLTIDANIKNLLYTDIEVQNIDGQLAIQDQTLSIRNAKAETLGGKFNVEGSYNTQNIERPAFDLKYKLQLLDFQKAFNTLNTFEILAPIGKFIQGSFNTDMSFSGFLGQDMMPDLNTLNAEGFMETLNSFVTNFKPLEKIGEKLNISALSRKIKIEDTRNWFTVQNGKVIIKEFDARIKDIDMLISGQHGISMDMDYNILAKIPRTMLEKNPVGQAANTGLEFLSKEASKYGINIQQGEFLNVAINLSGNIKDPKVQLKLVSAGGDQSLKEIAAEKFEESKQRALDSLNAVANKELEKAKDKADQALDKATDSIRTVVNKEADKLLDKAKQEAGKTLKNEAGKVLTDTLAGGAKSKLDSLLNGQGKAGTDELKDKLKDFNPFKKKKNEKENDKKSGNE